MTARLTSRRGDRDDGAVTVFVVVLVPALLAMAAISVDGGDVLAARERAHATAAQAARAGANALDLDSVRSGGDAIDSAAAQTAAQAILAADKLTGTVTVSGGGVSVEVTTTANTVMLGIVGITSLTVHASAAAQAVDGVTTMEPSP